MLLPVTKRRKPRDERQDMSKKPKKQQVIASILLAAQKITSNAFLYHMAKKRRNIGAKGGWNGGIFVARFYQYIKTQTQSYYGNDGGLCHSLILLYSPIYFISAYSMVKEGLFDVVLKSVVKYWLDHCRCLPIELTQKKKWALISFAMSHSKNPKQNINVIFTFEGKYLGWLTPKSLTLNILKEVVAPPIVNFVSERRPNEGKRVVVFFFFFWPFHFWE